MSSAKGKIIRLLAGAVLERAEILAVQGIGGFRRLHLRCEIPRFSAGAKVQVLLPSNDVRTYTPIPSPEGMVLLAWTKAGGPGTRWMSNARAGDELLFLGPRRSLQLGDGPVVIVGDETSVAVAAAFSAERPGQVGAVIQSDAASEAQAAADSVGLGKVDIVARGDIASTVQAVMARLPAAPDTCVALTGGLDLVVGARDALRRAGIRNIKSKAYWIPGKTGLD